MPKIVFLFALLVVTIQPVALPQTSSQSSEDVWFWSSDCPGPKTMGVQVLLDGKSIYHSSFLACQMNRTIATAEREQKARTTFHFSGGHTFQGMYHTRTTDTVEGTIWQAGADPDDILLGVSFVAHDQVLLNTIHIAKLGKPTESKLDRGIMIKTYPSN